jgi:hypothetical protein
MPATKKVQTSNATPAPQPSPTALVTDALPWLDLLDVLPVPLWIIGPQADLWFGNRAWHAVTSAASNPVSPSSIDWLQVLHEEDRHRAVTAFHSAAAFRRGVDVNVRLRVDDSFRSWSFVGHPYCSQDGEVEMFVGAAHDTTAPRMRSDDCGNSARGWLPRRSRNVRALRVICTTTSHSGSRC